ncbi:MAG TPA: T9SS type A sorting domain-containing protein [Chitinophagaceae bacterium]|nr:T9SS type A sorting domain-containing protein [Chitinophagaceae bacterium]
MSIYTLVSKHTHFFSFLYSGKHFFIFLLSPFLLLSKVYSQQGSGLGSKPEYSCSIAGPVSTCNLTSSLSYTATLQGYNGAIKYQWSLINNTAGAVLSGQVTGLTVDKSIGINIIPVFRSFIPGGHFNLRLIVYRGINADTCYLNSHTSLGQTVSIVPVQIATQGNITLACPRVTDNVPLAVSIGGCATGAIWTTSGTGTFYPNNNDFNPIYMPSQLDLFNGVVTINVQTTGSIGSPASTSFTITIPSCLPPPGTINPVRLSNITHIKGQQEVNVNNNNIHYPNGGINITGFKPDADITIYPNPNRGSFTIRSAINGAVDIMLVNKLGITVQKWSNVHLKTMRIQGYKPGIYTLFIFDRNTQKQVSKKIVIQD